MREKLLAWQWGLYPTGHRDRKNLVIQTPPVPFLGPLDFLSRLFVEQWVTFPRFVLSGGFRRAWASRVEPAQTLRGE